jgi:hypothetical protein
MLAIGAAHLMTGAANALERATLARCCTLPHMMWNAGCRMAWQLGLRPNTQCTNTAAYCTRLKCMRPRAGRSAFMQLPRVHCCCCFCCCLLALDMLLWLLPPLLLLICHVRQHKPCPQPPRPPTPASLTMWVLLLLVVCAACCGGRGPPCTTL